MWKLVELINQKEIRNLLIADSWPENYFDESLDKAAESIFQEFDRLRSVDSFLKNIQEKDIKINQDARLTILYGVRQLFDINPNEAKRVIDECKLEYKTKEEVIRAINKREFDKKVKELKEKSLQNVTNKNQTFEEIMTPIVIYFKISFANIRDITVSEFCALENQYKDYLKAEKKSA